MIIDTLQDAKIKSHLSDLSVDDGERSAKFLADRSGLPYIDLRIKSPELSALQKVPLELSEKFEVAPFKLVDKTLHIAVLNPTNDGTINYLRSIITGGYELIIYIASNNSIKYVQKRYSDLEEDIPVEKGVLDIFNNDLKSIKSVQTQVTYIVNNIKKDKITKIIETIFEGAVSMKASDIHIEPEEDKVRVRYRLDGNLNDIFYTDLNTFNLINSRLKILSGLKLSNTKIAQDGRMSLKNIDSSSEVEIRVSTVPGSYGENYVMRLLDPSNANVPFESLGMNDVMLRELEKAINKPFGMILTTGPTGSGKSTTLYSCLRKIYTPETKVITIEDPVEYHFDGITQTQVDTKKNYTFLSGLRAALRQDPDVIMVGEIRDNETANIAAQAALTGHIVLSTLHTNSAAGAIPRFINLGVDPKTLGSSLNFVMAQRLCRKLCINCKVSSTSNEKDSRVITNILGNMIANNKNSKYKPSQNYNIWLANPVGCEKCNNGYKGRIGIFEGIVMNSKIEEASTKGGGERDIMHAAEDQDIPSMLEDGIIKVLDGTTSIEELKKVVDIS